MTECEAIKGLGYLFSEHELNLPCTDSLEILHMAVSALSKQIPKKPITYKGTNRADCPLCGATVRGIKEPFGDWCSKCGQALDWDN